VRSLRNRALDLLLFRFPFVLSHLVFVVLSATSILPFITFCVTSAFFFVAPVTWRKSPLPFLSATFYATSPPYCIHANGKSFFFFPLVNFMVVSWAARLAVKNPFDPFFSSAPRGRSKGLNIVPPLIFPYISAGLAGTWFWMIEGRTTPCPSFACTRNYFFNRQLHWSTRKEAWTTSPSSAKFFYLGEVPFKPLFSSIFFVAGRQATITLLLLIFFNCSITDGVRFEPRSSEAFPAVPPHIVLFFHRRFLLEENVSF